MVYGLSSGRLNGIGKQVFDWHRNVGAWVINWFRSGGAICGFDGGGDGEGCGGWSLRPHT